MAQPFDADKLEVTGEGVPLVDRIRYSWGPDWQNSLYQAMACWFI
jgi:hypothetical protein